MSQIAEAFVRVRLDTSGVPGQLKTVGRELQSTERQFGAFGRGAAYGSGALRSLGRAALYTSGTLIGSYGLTVALKDSLNAAKDHQVVEGQLAAAVHAAGLSYGEYRGRIQDVIKAQEDLGFAENDSARAFTLALRATKDVTGAQKLQALAADVARGRNMSLLAATQLLVRVQAGQVGSLRRLGIEVAKGVTGQQALILVQKQYAGAAEAYSHTAQGAQDRLDVAIHRTEVTIGTALIPTLTKLSTRLADWLDKSGNQKRIQDDVNKAVKLGSEVVGDITTAYDDLKGPVTSVVHALGGFKTVAEEIIALKIALKIAAVAKSFGLMQAAAKTTAAVVATTSAEEVASIETVGVASATAATKMGALLARLGPLALILAATQSRGGLKKGIFAGVPGYDANGNKLSGPQYLTGPTPPPQIVSVPSPLSIPGSASGSIAGGLASLSPSARNQLALTAAAGTASTVDDLNALRDQRAILAAKIGQETERLKHAISAKQAQKFADNLQALESQDNAAAGQITSIMDQAAAAAAERASKAKTAAAKAAAEKAKLLRGAVQYALEGVGPLGVDVTLQKKLEAARARVAATARATAISIQEGALTIARQAADLAVQRAGSNQTLIDKATALERKADERLIKFYKDRIAATKGLARQGYQQQLLAAQSDLVGLKKKSSAASGFTLAQLYGEADSEFALYGSNVGGPGTPLSPQDARGAYSGAVKRERSTVVIQNFYGERSAGQAMHDARAVARNAK